MATSARSHERSGAKSATANRTSGCIPLIYSPSRRSTSLARQQPHHENRSNKNVTDHGPAGCVGSDIGPTRVDPGGKVNAVPNISGQGQNVSSRVFSQHEMNDSNTRSCTNVDMTRATETRKSHTSSVSNSNKESGGRKILVSLFVGAVLVLFIILFCCTTNIGRTDLTVLSL
ncbi:hypothetical protein FBUS_01987 [Fasciolopsis buskii]|uniref:Uncharacterized protein n=1 Tax=Fasciolopsis buskii TaxID=27845 RepID=A0A8E0RUF5_9TREM|nr:hypothetical protein FBUS_01987 [Fasciolopsis buski]